MAGLINLRLLTDFFNKIRRKRPSATAAQRAVMRYHTSGLGFKIQLPFQDRVFVGELA